LFLFAFGRPQTDGAACVTRSTPVCGEMLYLRNVLARLRHDRSGRSLIEYSFFITKRACKVVLREPTSEDKRCRADQPEDRQPTEFALRLLAAKPCLNLGSTLVSALSGAHCC